MSLLVKGFGWRPLEMVAVRRLSPAGRENAGVHAIAADDQAS